MEIIGWILLGLIAGALAKLIYPGDQGGGILATTGLGILGALVGGWLASLIGIGGSGIIGSLIVAVLGAILLIFIWGLITRRTA